MSMEWRYMFSCTFAAMNGHLEILKWARTNQCPWNEDTCACAAKNGHLEILKWARANQCPWDEETCRRAANNGHLGCPWDEETKMLIKSLGILL